METIRLYMLTWNVATRPPEEDVTAMLGLGEQTGNFKLPDVYVIGLQEVKSQPQNMLMDALMGNPWTHTFRDPLSKCGYIVARTIRLQGIVLTVFILREHILRIRDIETLYTKTGFGGMWGNKGAVSIRLSVSGVSLCLINCHLTPHDHLLADRISDYNNILDEQVFSNQETANIFFHDYVFWIGDLNFRLKEEAGTAMDIVKKLETKSKNKSGSYFDNTKRSCEKVKEAVDDDSEDMEMEGIRALLQDDQLKSVMTSGAAFSELREEAVTFPPTYKFLFNSSVYDLKRRPSWTDRILYRVNENAYENLTLCAKQLSYRSHPQYVQSDHKPVSAQFDIKVLSDYEDRLVKFHPVGTWYLDEENFATFAMADDVRPTAWDWIGVFKENFTSLEDYVTYVYVPRLANPFKAVPTEVAEEAAGETQDGACGGIAKDAVDSSKSGGNLVKHQSWMRVSFPDTSLQSTGTFQLLYLTQTSSSVLGISSPFRVERRANCKMLPGMDNGMQRIHGGGGASSAPCTPSRVTLD
ncbi:inositol polyphosphate 5-phosphatase K-like [Hetaerina americana]|uniref:inositol polyphosphate 5-phosphatase K-like n=1 Tax=Hetaerina americana TaxID=62018 RepID=UPI003A7F4AE3